MRNEKLESFLVEMNEVCSIAEDEILKRYTMPAHPVVMILGCARSGSTLLLQWLAKTGVFAYPSNFISRFYKAPSTGAMIQRMLTDPELNFRDEFNGYVSEINYDSDLGKTRGILAPNEFWYFWRRFFPDLESAPHQNEGLRESADWELFAAELAAIEGAFNKPLAMKAMIINTIIPQVSEALDKVLFINMVRDPIFNAESLLEARKKYFGSIENWYSFKPAEFNDLKELDPFSQVAGQVYFTRKHIEKGLRQIEDDRRLTISYEQFCADPSELFNNIKQKFNAQGIKVNWDYTGPSSFECRNILRAGEDKVARITDAYRMFEEQGDS